MTRSRQEIEATGIPTGILATVRMTRSASIDQLAASGERRLQRMMRHGTTTAESKTGYGLSLEHELKMLQVNERLQHSQPVDLVSTFLGAHDFPPEISRERYIEEIIHEMIPMAAESRLAVFCDVYCDDGYYTVDESRRILEAGLAAGLAPKIHTDAYSDIGGTSMAAELGVVSADHLNYSDRAALEHLADSGVTAVVMPALDFAVRHPRPFNGRAMLDAGLMVALATDFCPACWVESMQLVMALACRLYRFTPEEALYAATAGGASALALTDRGTLKPGNLADIQIWAVPGLDDIIYRLGANAVEIVIKRGQVFIYPN
jgi:imidazolonepropionase